MLSPDHANAKLLERLYEAAASGNPAVMAQAIREPFVAHTAGHGLIGGTFVGLDAFRGHIALLRALCDGTLKRKSIEFYADDHWAVTPQVLTASRGGRDLEMAVTGFWRFSVVGQIAEHWEAVSDEAAWDAFRHTPSVR
jgi:hypothetical protein